MADSRSVALQRVELGDGLLELVGDEAPALVELLLDRRLDLAAVGAGLVLEAPQRLLEGRQVPGVVGGGRGGSPAARPASGAAAPRPAAVAAGRV